MTKKELNRKYQSSGIKFTEKWAWGWIVKAANEKIIKDTLSTEFIVKGIGIGYDYNSEMVSLYAEAKDARK